MEKVEKLELETLIKQKKEIWVMNNSNPMAKIAITFKNINGASQLFAVPRTWIPVNVSETIPLELIKGGTDFKQQLRSGIITLISEEEAHEVMKSEDAQAEHKRLYRSQFAAGSAAGERAKELQQAFHARDAQEKLKNETLELEAKQKLENQVHPSIVTIITKYVRKEDDAVVTKNKIRTLKNELSIRDLSYVVAEADGEVRRFASKLLEEKKSSPELSNSAH